jgi:serine/threonine-protein kinase RsbW/sigma-B regulation protein RsbU (phosphoserine phosphatase)
MVTPAPQPGLPARTIRIPAESSQLAEVRAFVRAAGADLGASAAVTADLVQAVDEAVSNIIVHGYAGASGEVEIQAGAADGKIQIRVLDRSRPFDPTAAPPPDVSSPPRHRKPGGMGIHLLRAGTDEVHHRSRDDGGNELRLVRALDDAARED